MKGILMILLTLLSLQQGKVRKDPMDRAYIYPERIVWISSETAVKGSEVLLEEGNGQVPSPSGRHCRMRNSGEDKASIILDYGRELHGGLKLCLRCRNLGIYLIISHRRPVDGSGHSRAAEQQDKNQCDKLLHGKPSFFISLCSLLNRV